MQQFNMAASMKKLFIVIKFVEKMGLSDLKLKAGSQFLTSLSQIHLTMAQH